MNDRYVPEGDQYCGRETVHLVHQSAYDYLIGVEHGADTKLGYCRLQPEAGHFEITEFCTSYMERIPKRELEQEGKQANNLVVLITFQQKQNMT